MPLKPHHHLHPVRRTLGVVILLAIVALLLLGVRREGLAARQVADTVRGWMEQAGEVPADERPIDSPAER